MDCDTGQAEKVIFLREISLTNFSYWVIGFCQLDAEILQPR